MRDLGPDVHREPFLHLAGMSATEAIIAWGAFFFRRDGGGPWRLLDDEELGEVDPGRQGSIGASSTPYGAAVVELTDEAGTVVRRLSTSTANHVEISDLQPSTTYRYRVSVDGEPWAAGERWDWIGGAEHEGGHLAPSGRAYACTFRTLPHHDDPSPVRLAVLGDQGVGLQAEEGRGAQQRAVAEALDAAVTQGLVQLVVTTGDNIYLGPRDTTSGSGDEDDDWYFSYYQPYRYVIDRVPVYPSVGNHDTSDTEASDDREQLADNLFTEQRFASGAHVDAASVEPGLNYRVRVGSLVELTCIDTSLATDLEEEHFFEHPSHRAFLEASFPPSDGPPEPGAGLPVWRIPFCHHPPYTAGPSHPNHDEMIEQLVPLWRRAGVRLVLGGHEHNFQHNVVDGITYVVSGAGGKLRTEPPRALARAGTRSWSATCHLCLLSLWPDEAVLTAIGRVEDGRLVPIERITAEGGRTSDPIRIPAGPVSAAPGPPAAAAPEPPRTPAPRG